MPNPSEPRGGLPVAASPVSEIPPRLARVLAFVSVLLGGICGALLGHGLADFECVGSCDAWHGTGIFTGALVGAVGVAIVAVVTLRAMGEWDTLRES
jgi:hypothetical protein